jgi:hypothetical protein
MHGSPCDFSIHSLRERRLMYSSLFHFFELFDLISGGVYLTILIGTWLSGRRRTP